MEKITEENEKIVQEQERTGNTIVSSVSITRPFKKLIDEYEISPTDALRRGVAVTLYDRGITKFQTPLNEKRSEFVKKFFADLKSDAFLQKQFNEMVKFSRQVTELAKQLNWVVTE